MDRRFTHCCALVLLTLVALPFTAPFQTFAAANDGNDLQVVLTLTPADADDAGASVVAPVSSERTRPMIVPIFNGPSSSSLTRFVAPPAFALDSLRFTSLPTVLRL